MKRRCSKCKGEGILDSYLHVNNGRCFTCGGSGTIEPKKQMTPAEVAAYRRKTFIDAFAGALAVVKEWGVGHLDRRFLADDAQVKHLVDFQRDKDCPRRELLQKWLASPDCPADVRGRAISAFSAIGVDFK